ncbi:hypothetical protein CEN47_17485, partial [Fischerella thermalis CCMEE 5319]
YSGRGATQVSCKNKDTPSLNLFYPKALPVRFLRLGAVLLLLSFTPIVIGHKFEELVNLYAVYCP